MPQYSGCVPRFLTGLLALLVLTGCSAAPLPQPEPSPLVSISAAPEDGVLLSALGFEHAPAGLSIPRGSIVAERTDNANNITVVFSSPTGVEIASYLRRSLPELGFVITADKDNSLLFEGGPYQGAFTASGPLSALTLRTDR